MANETVPLRFLAQRNLRPNQKAFAVFKDEQWHYTTWQEYVDQAMTVARALIALGVKAQDKVCILGFNRPEWSLFAMGNMLIAAVPIGIYTTCSREEIKHILNHSDAKLILIENAEQWTMIESLLPECPKIERVIFMDTVDTQNVSTLSWMQLLSHAEEISNEQVEFRVNQIHASDLATLIYTSGTTGPAKGVMLDHSNILWMALNLSNLVNASDQDVLLSYLPLCHIAEQMVSIHAAACVGFCVHYAESMERVPDNLASVQPTIFFGVPRVWEKFYQGIQAKLADVSGSKKLLLHLANKTGEATAPYFMQGKALPYWLKLKYYLFNRLLFSKLKTKLGLGRARICTSGGGPLALDILEWFTRFDIIIQEVYGQSEITGATSLNANGKTRLGTVGQVLPGIEVKLNDDNEICLRGPCVFAGYYKDPEQTEKTIDNAGWMASGDLGVIDDDGFLSITGRKKEIIITAGGKNITPRNIEEELCKINYITQAIVIGDRRRFLSALLTVDTVQASRLSETHNANTILSDTQFLARLQRDIDHVNDKFARVEHIRKYHLLSHDFSIESGELTPTMKVKRDFVAKKYQKEIDAMYE